METSNKIEFFSFFGQAIPISKVKVNDNVQTRLGYSEEDGRQASHDGAHGEAKADTSLRVNWPRASS